MSANKILLAVSVGARSTEALAGIAAVEHALASAFPDRSVSRAFLGAAFREYAPSPAEAVAALRAQGTEDMIIQPLLLTAGVEYKKLLIQTRGLRLGKPLLADAVSRRAAARAILDALPPEGKTVHLWVGHGGAAGAEGRALGLDFSALGRTDVGVYDKENPLTGISHAVLHPLLLTCGGHTRRDLDALRTRLEAAGTAVFCCYRGLGERPSIPALFANLAREVDT